MTLYMKIGGRTAIENALPALREALEADPCFDLPSSCAEFEQSGDLCEFLVFLFGGSPVYDGKPAASLLSPLCSCEDAYERFVDHLVAVFFGPSGNFEGEEGLRTTMSRLRPRVLSPKPVPPVLVYSIENELMHA